MSHRSTARARVSALGLIMSCALLGAKTAHAQGPTPAPETVTPQTPAQIAEAEQHFKRGIKLFDDGDFKLALVEFERSYDLSPNFRVLYNIGEVQFQLNRYANALRTLSRYLEVGGERILPNRRAEVQRDLEALKIRTAHVKLNIDVAGAEVLVDGERIGRAPLAESELIDAGAHRIVVQKPGFLSYSESLTLAGADEKTLDVRLVPAPEKDDRRIVEVHEAPGLGPVWIGWGLTVALAAGTVGTAVAWQNADSKLTDLKNSESSATERDSQARTVDTLRPLTFAVGSATLVAAGLSLFFTLRRMNEPTRTPIMKGSAQRALTTGTFEF